MPIHRFAGAYAGGVFRLDDNANVHHVTCESILTDLTTHAYDRLLIVSDAVVIGGIRRLS